MPLTLDVLPGRLAVARLDATAPVPAWATAGVPASITRTTAELSVVCPQELVPATVRHVGGYRALAVRGPLDFELTGILSGLTGALAAAHVPVFVLSTFDTDLVLVPEERLGDAVAALHEVGHRVAGR